MDVVIAERIRLLKWSILKYFKGSRHQEKSNSCRIWQRSVQGVDWFPSRFSLVCLWIQDLLKKTKTFNSTNISLDIVNHKNKILFHYDLDNKHR